MIGEENGSGKMLNLEDYKIWGPEAQIPGLMLGSRIVR